MYKEDDPIFPGVRYLSIRLSRFILENTQHHQSRVLKVFFFTWSETVDSIANERALVTVFRQDQTLRRLPRIFREWKLLREAKRLHRLNTQRKAFLVLKRILYVSKEDIPLRMAAESYFILRSQLYAVKRWRIKAVSLSLRRKQKRIALQAFADRSKRKHLFAWRTIMKHKITNRLITELSDGHYARHTLQKMFSWWQQRAIQSMALKDAGALGRAKKISRALQTWRSVTSAT